MVKVSEDLASYIKKTGRHFDAKIKVGDTVITDGIDEITLFSPFMSDKMSFGSVVSAYVEVRLFNCNINLAGREIEISLTATVDGKIEEIKLGFFTAEKPKTADGVTSFTAYDRAKTKVKGEYQTELSGDNAIDAVFNDVCSQCGVECEPLFSSATAENDKPKVSVDIFNGLDKKAVLGQIAAYFGGNLICNRDGKLEVRTLSECTETYDGDMCDVPEIGDSVFNLKKLICDTGKAQLTVGEEGDGVSFACSFMTQERLDEILIQLKKLTKSDNSEQSESFEYRELSCDILVGDPRIEVGDIVTVKSGTNEYKVPVMQCEITFDGGISSKIQSFAKKESETETERTVSASEKINRASSYAKAAQKAHDSFLETLRDGLSGGLYQTTIDGAIYYHNTPDITQSTYIQTFNSAGRAWTSGSGCWNGGSPVWKYGETKDGDAILRDLLVRTLTADLIKAGKLSSFDGDTYFDLDNAEIVTKSQGENTTLTGTIRAGYAEFKKVKNNTSEDEDDILSDSILGEAGLFMQTVEPDEYSFVPPDTIDVVVDGVKQTIPWASASAMQKLPYILKSLAKYLETSSFGINIITKGKDGEEYTVHFDGMGINFDKGTVKAKDLIFKYNGTDVSLVKFVDAALVGVAVEAGTDIDDLNLGRYNIESNAIAQTCTHLPVVSDGKPVAGYLEVFALGQTGYILQRFTPYNNAGIFTRWYNQYNNAGWGNWMKYSATVAQTYVA